jgi:hypothetical protein
LKYLAFSPDKKYRLVIEDDTVGYYLFIYANGNDLPQEDYMQDTFQIAKEQAFELYEVDPNSWVQIE